MRSYPDMKDEWDREEVERLKPEPWMLDALKMNPDYVHWGPREDYLWNEGPGWNSRILIDTWAEFQWGLDEYNECVNFYFEVGSDEGESSPHLSLILWIIHPRKGASRGVEIKRIEKHELPQAVAFLQEAERRNAERFSRLDATERKEGE